MQVAPLATALPSENERSDRMPKALGLLWLWLVLVPSFYYLTLLQPHLANDLFWPNYNASGYQIFVIDLLNALLESTPDASTVDLSLEMVDARYDGVLPNAMVHPTYAMALLTTSRSSLEGAIISLRNTSLNSVHWLPTQYCWIDFDKTFELAYTESRQKRCFHRYAANGAVYLEAVYRNMDWSAYVAKYGSRNSNLWWAILRGLESSQRGVDWMKTVASVSTLVPAEVVYWQRAGIEVFHYQWQSVELPGLVETATLLNALGIPTSLTLKSIEHSQGPGLSISFYESFLLGIWVAGSSNASLIRGSSDYFLNSTLSLGAPPLSLENFAYGFNMFGAHQVSLVHSTLGPFLSIDLLVLSPPVALVSLTKSVSAALYESLNSASPTTYATLRTLTVAPIPPAWKQYVYYGGNLMCSYDTPQTFLQPPFTTTDACDVQTLWTVSVAPLAMVSALSLVSDSIESICALGTSDACTPFLQQAKTLALRTLNQTLVQDAVTAVRALDVSVIQAASDVTETNYTLLRQPLLDQSPFAFYGWVLLFDWVVGVREVVSFEGDNGTLVLISDDYDTTAQTSPASSVLSRASITVYYLVVYSTLVLGALVLVCTVGLCSHRRPVHRASIAYFYRVASSTWLGRPLVLLRGTTAMLLLSSAPWQNYKSIGLVNSYNIVNAYGISYPFMLQATAGYHRLESQTSFKMYWSLASDLGALLKNTSTISGKSLLRSSSRFAFQNTSLQEILVTEKMLPPWPWSANYELLSSYLGPFGSIDMVYVSVPSVLSEAICAFDVAVAGARKLATSSYVLIRDEYHTFPAPALWAKTVYAASGSVLCPDQPSAYLAKLTLILGADAYQKGCEALYHTALSMVSSRDHILFSVLVAGIDATTNVTAICLLEPLSNIPYCETKLHTAMAFLLHVPDLSHWRPSLYAAIHELQIQWVQFGALNTTAPMELYHLPVLDPSDATFDYVAWLFLYDWALGNREVISFQGDLGTLTAMGSDLPHLEQTDDAAQLPTVLALYARRAVQYVTVSIIALAVLSLIYLIRVRGAIEGRNLLKLSRVGGLVWVGRPLIGLRSITALALLSSASVQLTTDGQLSYFTSQAVPWYTTCLAANEVTWLVGIVNDLGLPWTTWHLPKYALINSLLVWLVSALLAILAPVQASISIAKSCAVVSLDYQVQCSAGAVLIGSRARLLTLIGVVFGCNVLCYSVARWYYQDDSRLRSSSLLLCSGAKFLFRHETWIKHDVYYMDRASAVVNGLVSVGWRDEWFVMDVKTWRLHRLSNGET
ncbi:hypothetical protein SDRG_14543 [Saprolegnia diclina VS20]|uniref:Uncharacterized protein n=1 Tax=Saprolegnia diclina (strain VS20) TaxID=1156394 RepID=T0RDG6_SAPDV|nr:hypothetical protein SDRG_14543 [Saprolegnia diclina VS20]EQC27632.1 hypothetical protein SDRG_14543 [Saprolegnia diclina VS20]|eukprot:XP_008618900.1 hypothetical protein SDRG_14543 [Saprolegnia diclina VS20]